VEDPILTGIEPHNVIWIDPDSLQLFRRRSKHPAKMKHLMILATAAMLLTASLLAASAEDAPPGFSWKYYAELGVTVQVPDGWHSQIVAGKGTKALQISKENPGPKGFETGLTINLIERATDDAMAEATIGIGKYMEKLHDSFSEIIESKITKREGNLTMILEGVRTLPDQKERGLYHTRTTVYVLKPSRRIFTIVFGSPAALWEGDYKFGTVMLNPLKFDAE
jgi:hypothetical protein